MEKYSKGKKTRISIINQINTLFNEKEMLLTWDEIAVELELSRSRITNYFPKKELLILAIYHQFEEKLKTHLENKPTNDNNINLNSLKDYYASVMDLLFNYRFSISYVLVNPTNDRELSNHIDRTYANSKVRLQKRVEKLVKAGIINEQILSKKHFRPFTFQHTTLLTTWVISYRLYDKNLGYKKMKPIYLQGILNCYSPFLTEEGKEQMNAVFK